jgi:hypothetical protein
VPLSCTPASTTDQHVIARLLLLLLDWLSGATAAVPVPRLRLLLAEFSTIDPAAIVNLPLSSFHAIDQEFAFFAASN